MKKEVIKCGATNTVYIINPSGWEDIIMAVKSACYKVQYDTLSPNKSGQRIEGIARNGRVVLRVIYNPEYKYVCRDVSMLEKAVFTLQQTNGGFRSHEIINTEDLPYYIPERWAYALQDDMESMKRDEHGNRNQYRYKQWVKSHNRQYIDFVESVARVHKI